jgi:hypothetical protein
VIEHWRRVVEPLLGALEPRVVVEVGVFEGTTTEKVLELLAERGGLVRGVDPIEKPRFDLEGFRERFGDRFVFHNEPSLEALPKIRDADAVLIDGDHNWYTVYHELSALAAVAADERRPFPLTLLHDVDWPFGRRDGYYAPERIPAEYRHPTTTDGLAPWDSELVEGGGIGLGMTKAKYEGTPRNGVRTAIEDFIANTEVRISFTDVAGWNGLGIVVGEELLDREPPVRELIERFNSPKWLKDQCYRIEKWRLLAVDRGNDLQREARRLTPAPSGG